MLYSFQILTVPGPDSGPSIMFTFSDKRYLINCGEGTQRFCQEHKVKLLKLKSIIFTKPKWSATSGIPGMLLTTADQGLTELNLIGPSNFGAFVNATRFFRNVNSMKTNYMNHNDSDKFIFEDENLKIESIFTIPCITGVKRKMSDEEEKVECYQKYCNKKENLPVFSYIFTGPEVRVSDIDIKKKKKVLNNSPVGDLSEGKSVTLEDGSVVHPHQVLEKAKPILKTIIIECPKVDYIESLISNQKFDILYGKNDIENPIGFIIHIVGDGVLNDKRYIDWMNKFCPISHIILNHEFNPHEVIFVGSSKLQRDLNYLDEKIFPLPYYNVEPLKSFTNLDYTLPSNTILGEPLMSVVISPNVKLDYSESIKNSVDFLRWKILKSNTELVLKPKFLLEPFIRRCEAAKKAIKLKEKDLQNLNNENLEVDKDDYYSKTFIIPLGTGSAIPSKYRNVSSTLVILPSKSVIILDCGEATLGQIIRHYGPDTTNNEILKNLKLMFISHMHADHHLGFLSIYKKWLKVRKPNAQLNVICPVFFVYWLRDYNVFEDIQLANLNLIDAQTFNALTLSNVLDGNALKFFLKVGSVDKNRIQKIKKGLLEDMGVKNIEVAEVKHCKEAFGIAITDHNVGKIVFSGDCRPSESLITIGVGAEILIHEATFEDEMIEEAISKRHSTIGEAIDVALKMEAKRLLLTHFSQRYPNLPSLNFDSVEDNKKLTVNDMKISAEDNFVVKENVTESGETPSTSISEESTNNKNSEKDIILASTLRQEKINKSNLLIGVSFDSMRINLKDFWKLQYFIEPIKYLFNDEGHLIDNRNNFKNLK
ncbi:Zinc phosphodiesterase ELAC protein 2 [Clydaea vesicula]|uniref:ribonuclease Z n=1 Tax=Clydaea vesicula TaxID=447962 RepID=A0AAD5U3J3_9FUNG|nr:Zinc phosphodiesterase ELAC protein 2 [Clydaea vesicula]